MTLEVEGPPERGGPRSPSTSPRNPGSRSGHPPQALALQRGLVWDACWPEEQSSGGGEPPSQVTGGARSTQCIHPASLVMGASAGTPDAVERSVGEGNSVSKQNGVRRAGGKGVPAVCGDVGLPDPGTALPTGCVRAPVPLCFLHSACGAPFCTSQTEPRRGGFGPLVHLAAKSRSPHVRRVRPQNLPERSCPRSMSGGQLALMI